MASKRRGGGGFRPPELRGTLGTLLRTTTDVVRDALERGAREGRARLDDARAHRRRQDALADLGELVLDLIRRGEIDLAELPEARDLIRQLDDFDAEPADEPEPEPPRAAVRRRFDDRSRRGPTVSGPSPTVSGPSPGPAAAAADNDGTVSSGAAARFSRPTTPGSTRDSEASPTRAPTRPMKHIGRSGPGPDTAADAPFPPDRPPTANRSAPTDHPAPADRPAPKRAPLAPDPHRKGGISFDDDDLNEYMHPDDVPPKSPLRNPGDGEA